MKRAREINEVDQTDSLYLTYQLEVMRFQQVTSWQTIFRSSRPGYPRKAVPRHSLKTAVTEIWQMGITTVVDLLSDAEAYKYYGIDLARFYRRTAKFHVIRCPIPDFSVPRVSFMLSCCRRIAIRHATGQSVLIHCSAGMGRTGLTLNSYAIYRTVVFGESPINFGVCEVTEQDTFLQLFRAYVKKHAKCERIICSKQQLSERPLTTKKISKV